MISKKFIPHPYLSPYEKPVEEFFISLYSIFKEELQLQEGFSEDFLIPGDRFGMMSCGGFSLDTDKSPTRARGTREFCLFEIYLIMILGAETYLEAQLIGARSAIALSSVISSFKSRPELKQVGGFYDLVPDNRIDYTLAQDIKAPHYFRVQVGCNLFAKLAIKTNVLGVHEYELPSS